MLPNTRASTYLLVVVMTCYLIGHLCCLSASTKEEAAQSKEAEERKLGEELLLDMTDPKRARSTNSASSPPANASTTLPTPLQLLQSPQTEAAPKQLPTEATTKAPASTAEPTSPPLQHKTILIGRIEQIAASDKLMNPLYAGGNGNALFDHRSKSDTGNDYVTVHGYPAEFVGIWSGKFTVVQNNNCTPSNDPLLYPGREGTGTLGFSQDQNKLAALKNLPIVFFELKPADKKYINISDAAFASHPRVHIGFGEAHNAVLGDGSIKNSRNVTNKIQQLREKSAMEQQILEVSEIFQPKTQKTFSAIREAVFQFAPLPNNLLDVYLAAVEYKIDGTCLDKVLLHGVLKKEDSSSEKQQ